MLNTVTTKLLLRCRNLLNYLRDHTISNCSKGYIRHLFILYICGNTSDTVKP